MTTKQGYPMKTAFRQFELKPCSEMVAQNERGLFGFHDYVGCKSCEKLFTGFRIHDGDSIFAPFISYSESKAECSSVFPIYYRR